MDGESRRITQVGGPHNKNYYLNPYGLMRFKFVGMSKYDRFSYSVGGGGFEEFYNPPNELIRTCDFGGNIEHDIVIGLSKNGID